MLVTNEIAVLNARCSLVAGSPTVWQPTPCTPLQEVERYPRCREAEGRAPSRRWRRAKSSAPKSALTPTTLVEATLERPSEKRR